MSFILLLCVGHSTFFPSEALPVEKLPKGGQWEASGSDDDSEREEIYITPEHKVYMRLSNPGLRLDRSIDKKSATYIRKGKLFNRNGYLLRINSDGTVDGTTEKSSMFGECCRIYEFVKMGQWRADRRNNGTFCVCSLWQMFKYLFCLQSFIYCSHPPRVNDTSSNMETSRHRPRARNVFFDKTMSLVISK